MEGINEWEKQKAHPTESFHMDPRKEVDPVERLIAERGLADALHELSNKLDENPDDQEVRRQVALIINRTEDLAQRAAELKQRIQH